MGSFGIPGFDTGIDVQGLVEQVLYIERAPIRALESEKKAFQNKINAYNDLNSKLSALLSSLDALNSADSFSAKKTSSSDEEILTATAGGDASPGTYQIQVSRLALFDNYVSDSTFTDANGVIGMGSFDLTVGSETTSITIDTTNNTLEGLRNTINNSGAAVRASIIYDGSGYRLTITSEESGSGNAISIANNTLTLSDGSLPLSLTRTHSIADESELDASLVVNGLAITSTSNEVIGVIEGVTLNLKGTSGTVNTVVVSNDLETVADAIQEFVDHYNEAYSFLNSQFTYVEAAGSAGALAGESLVRNIQSALADVVSRSIGGITGPLNNLAAAGIEMQNDGTLQVNQSRLEANLADDFSALRNLFIATAQATHASIEYVGSGSGTAAGTYEIDISQAAEAAQILSPNAIGGTLGVDETLTFSLGSNTSIVTLTSAMTVDEVVAAMNAQFSADALALIASKDGTDHLVVTSSTKGSAAAITAISNQTNPSVGTGIGTSGVSDIGVDVAGTFTDTSTGTVYSATGKGDVLIGAEGPVIDLRIQFLGSTTGTFGTISVTFGYAEKLERTLDSYVDSLEGPISGAVEYLEANIRRIDDDIQNLEDRLVYRERYLTDEFSRVNQALQELSYLQTTLSQQLGVLDSLT